MASYMLAVLSLKKLENTSYLFMSYFPTLNNCSAKVSRALAAFVVIALIQYLWLDMA